MVASFWKSTLNISEFSFWMDSEVSGLFCICFVAIAVPGFSLLSSIAFVLRRLLRSVSVFVEA